MVDLLLAVSVMVPGWLPPLQTVHPPFDSQAAAETPRTWLLCLLLVPASSPSLSVTAAGGMVRHVGPSRLVLKEGITHPERGASDVVPRGSSGRSSAKGAQANSKHGAAHRGRGAALKGGRHRRPVCSLVHCQVESLAAGAGACRRLAQRLSGWRCGLCERAPLGPRPPSWGSDQ